MSSRDLTLAEKIGSALSIIKRAEPLSLELNPEVGFHVAFSGGKDSQVLLALVKLAGVKYTAYYNVTGIDSPENVYFIRKHYPEVTFVHPKQNFFRLVADKGLPTIQKRFCCERIKEHGGEGCVVLTGVRAEESKKRAAYSQVEIFSRRKEHASGERGRDDAWLTKVQHECIKGKDRVMVRPVLDFTEDDIWRCIDMFGLPHNPCYRKTGRVGCMFCPFSTKPQLKMYETDFPRYLQTLFHFLHVYWDKSKEHMLASPEQYYDWWKSHKTVQKYLADLKKREYVCSRHE